MEKYLNKYHLAHVNNLDKAGARNGVMIGIKKNIIEKEIMSIKQIKEQ